NAGSAWRRSTQAFDRFTSVTCSWAGWTNGITSSGRKTCNPCCRFILFPISPVAHCPAISVWPSGLRIEPEDAQLLIATTGLGDARSPRDSLVARRQFEHGEAAVKRGRPRIAAHCDCALSRDQHWRDTVVDSSPADD